MTFAELFVLIAAGLLIYFMLGPLRKRLERRLSRFLRSKMTPKDRPVIDITDYQKRRPKDSSTDKGPKNEV